MNNIEIEEGKWCKVNIIDQACRFDESMYDWTIEEILECLEKRSQNNFFYIEFSYKQLGKSEEWYKQQCRDLMNNMLLIRREILLEWTRASDVSVYTEEQLYSIEQHLKEPISKLEINKYWFIDIYKEVDYIKPYIVSCDVSTGLAQDASAFSIIDPVSIDVVAEFKANKIDTVEYENLLITLLGGYFIHSVLVMENNSVGKAVLDRLMRSPIGNRIYYEYKDRVASKIEYDKKEISYKKQKTKLQIAGITTTKESRELMLELLDITVNDEPEKLATKYIYSDIRGLERNKKGKIEHSASGHDDSLMSYLVGRYVLAYGTNLARFMLPTKRGESFEERRKNISRVGISLSKLNKDRISNGNIGNFSSIGRAAIEDIEDNEKKYGKNDILKKYNIMREFMN